MLTKTIAGALAALCFTTSASAGEGTQPEPAAPAVHCFGPWPGELETDWYIPRPVCVPSACNVTPFTAACPTFQNRAAMRAIEWRGRARHRDDIRALERESRRFDSQKNKIEIDKNLIDGSRDL